MKSSFTDLTLKSKTWFEIRATPQQSKLRYAKTKLFLWSPSFFEGGLIAFKTPTLPLCHPGERVGRSHIQWIGPFPGSQFTQALGGKWIGTGQAVTPGSVTSRNFRNSVPHCHSTISHIFPHNKATGTAMVIFAHGEAIFKYCSKAGQLKFTHYFHEFSALRKALRKEKAIFPNNYFSLMAKKLVFTQYSKSYQRNFEIVGFFW